MAGKKHNPDGPNAEERALERFTELMIKKISSIKGDWKKPWFTENFMAWPKNLSGREYNGMNALSNGIENARFLAASAETIFAHVDFPPDETAVVIDPPRKGCDKLFLDQLFAFSPSRVVYVSCNPATQVRDLVAFSEAGYRVTEVQPFDLFPQTKHLECVTTLDKTP